MYNWVTSESLVLFLYSKVWTRRRSFITEDKVPTRPNKWAHYFWASTNYITNAYKIDFIQFWRWIQLCETPLTIWSVSWYRLFWTILICEIKGYYYGRELFRLLIVNIREPPDNYPLVHTATETLIYSFNVRTSWIINSQ